MQQSLAQTVFTDSKKRGGLPAWSYASEEFFELEKQHVLHGSWWIAGHVNEIPDAGDYLTLDVAGERGLIVRGRDGVVRAFHNLCRHRGSRVVAESRGNCGSTIVCPFHGWCYGLDGSMRGVPASDSFGDAVERETMGLKPVEMEIWHGLIFLRFTASDRRSVAEMMAPFEEDIAAYRIEDMQPCGKPWASVQSVNWKAAVDVDSEGYHVPIAHPSLQELYGQEYGDEVVGDVIVTTGVINETPANLWSVRHYQSLYPENKNLPEHLRRAWVYYGLFPSTVITFYPEMVDFYQTLPLGVEKCVMHGRSYGLPTTDRATIAARYLNNRINDVTTDEDIELVKWSWEGMQSSAFDDFVLSDLEVGVRLFHDAMRNALPILNRRERPAPGAMAAINEEMAQAQLPAESSLLTVNA